MTNNAVLTSSPATILEAQAGETLLVTNLIFCNVNAVADVLQVYLVKAGGSVGDGSKIITDYDVQGKDTEMRNLDRYPLDVGEKLVAASTNGTITVTIGYLRKVNA